MLKYAVLGFWLYLVFELFKNFLLYVYEYFLHVCTCMYHTCANAGGEQMWSLDYLELEIYWVVTTK